MIKTLIINTLAVVLVALSLHVNGQDESSTDQDSSLSHDLGYFYDYSFGNMLKDGKSSDADLESLMRGLKDSLNQVPPALSVEQREMIFAVVRKRQAEVQEEREKAQAAEQEAQQSQGEANLKNGEAFLLENEKREGILVTASGLQYEVLEDKEGPKAQASSTVLVNYRGTFLDGEVFDESRDSPVEFGLQQVIGGWTEGLQLMSAGDKFRLYLHPDLAYGAGSVGPIPPNSVLIFDIELLEIK
ncbi:MAG: FKBP-type peptidyl-prolyl cis-trans isomerase [Gammaproteobacteria bacterium]|nr:FKBP-type peptidyl-prolyl cis-trans isomerase [Gammaproteobacteria bacterium]